MSSVLKQEITSALKGRDYKGLIELWSQNNQVIRLLISTTYDKKDIIAWRAIEAIGRVTTIMAEKQPDDVRNLAGRLLWMMRDESGGIGWSAPEILGEIIKNNPELCSDLAPVLISFHEEKMLRAGVLWAAGRIAEAKRELVISEVPIITSYLNDPEPNARGMALWSLGKIKPEGYNDVLKDLISDVNILIIYDKGEFHRITIRELAGSILRGESIY